METFKVFIRVEQHIWHKELILKLLSEKLKTHKVEVNTNFLYAEFFKNYPNVTKADGNYVYDFDAAILDKKEENFIQRFKNRNKKLRIIK